MKLTNMKNILFIILLFLLSLNVFNKFYFLTLALFFIILLISIVKKQSIEINSNMIFVLFFCIFYSILDATYPSISLKSIVHDLLYFMGYFFGYLLINKYNIDYEKYIIAIVSGSTLHGILNAVINIRTYGLNNNLRILPDFWTGDIWTATGQATLFILIVGFSYYGLFTKENNNIFSKFLTMIGLFFALFYNLFTASRTIFVITLIVYTICFLTNLFLTKNNDMLRHILPIIFTFLICIIIYYNNIFGIKGFVESMPLFNRLAQPDMTGLSDDPRFERWKYALQYFWQYPFGGLNFRNGIGYVHNLWLDAYDVAGILPFAFLVLYTIGVIKNIILITQSNKVTLDFKLLIIGINSAFMLQFMVEPILDGVPWLFILFCIIAGMTDRYYKNISK